MLLLRTVKHLKLIQVLYRVRFKLHQPSVDVPKKLIQRNIVGQWVKPVSRPISLFGPMAFRFLNEEHTINGRKDWDNNLIGKLWRYNLHYFDDLNAVDSKIRVDWHLELFERWVNDNPPFIGSAWESYPTSLRIVNWIKWSLSGNDLNDECMNSLQLQVAWLLRRLEIHLLGNHLFANAKALVFAGLFFEGVEADIWLKKGLSLLEREVPAQILDDGGQFELSPMYHAIATEDLLDLLNLIRTYQTAMPVRWEFFVNSWRGIIDRMLRWLRVMSHPDNKISFFNDATLGIAASNIDLAQYMVRLGYATEHSMEDTVIYLEESGYIRIDKGAAVALLDVANIGPDYIPGHAHADTLTFELSLFGQRMVVNSGISCYGASQERLRQRGTAAHNTVVINAENSSEVWSSFRVARRARPYGLNIEEHDYFTSIKCSHDGYKRLRGKPVHNRTWVSYESKFEIYDEIDGAWHTAYVFVHFHPDVSVEIKSNTELTVKLLDNREINCSVSGGSMEILESTYHPEFGLSIMSKCLRIEFKDTSIRTVFSWD